MLIDAEIIDAKGLLPWAKLMGTINQMAIDQLEATATELGLQGWHAHDLAIRLVRAALSKGMLTAYALRPWTDSVFGLSKGWWSGDVPCHQVEQSIRMGRLVIDRTLFGEQTLEWEVSNRPLFVTKDQFRQFLRIRPPSEGRLRRLSQEIVAEFERQQPGEGQKLRKVDFIKALMERLPKSNCTKASAMQAWKDYAPVSWKRHGRLRGPRR
jgi:hypothetical protein